MTPLDTGIRRALCLGAAGVSLAMSGALLAKDKPPYTALYVFGDSYSDMGARYLDGNGPTPPGYLAQRLEVPLTHSKDADAGGKSLNFAATGATTGSDQGEGRWCCQGMLDQIDDFAARVRAGKLQFKPETTLFFLAGGLNDTEIATATTVSNLTRQVVLLKELGAQHFTLATLPTRVPDFAEVGKRLNPAYEALVKKLKAEQGVDIYLNGWGRQLDAMLENPGRYGIVDSTSQCAGRALLKQDPTPCAKPDTYFYFHGGHPSTAVNRIVGEKLYQELMAR